MPCRCFLEVCLITAIVSGKVTLEIDRRSKTLRASQGPSEIAVQKCFKNPKHDLKKHPNCIQKFDMRWYEEMILNSSRSCPQGDHNMSSNNSNQVKLFLGTSGAWWLQVFMLVVGMVSYSPSGVIKHDWLENPRTEWRFLARRSIDEWSIFQQIMLITMEVIR